MATPTLLPGVNLQNVRQLLLVEVPNNAHTVGILYTWERHDHGSPWKKVADIPVSIGKHGATYGQGWIQWEDIEEEKSEGDGKTPLGLFPLLSTYGYAPPDANMRMPYLQVQPWHKCIDDSSSRYYNCIVDERIAEKDWLSAEDMLRADHLYKWGIVPGYNTSPPVPGKGSAIFMHLWRKPGHTTAGCTAMSEANMLQLLAWLQPQATPVLIQATADNKNDILHACGWALPH